MQNHFVFNWLDVGGWYEWFLDLGWTSEDMDATHIRNTVQYGARLEGDKGGTTIADATEDRGLIMDGCDRQLR